MIWFFLAGFISGAVGVMMFAHWWVRTHATIVRVSDEKFEELNNELEENKHD